MKRRSEVEETDKRERWKWDGDERKICEKMY